jgi:hypothetical protein
LGTEAEDRNAGARAWSPLTAIGALAGCKAPVSVQTPQGKAAFTADQVVLRVGELQTAAIQANGTLDPKTGKPVLDQATTRLIVQFCVDANTALKNAPNGWGKAVGAAWAKLKTQLPPVTNPAISSALSSIDVILAASGG